MKPLSENILCIKKGDPVYYKPFSFVYNKYIFDHFEDHDKELVFVRKMDSSQLLSSHISFFYVKSRWKLWEWLKNNW